MYETKENHSYGIIAIIYYCIYFISMLIAGRFYKENNTPGIYITCLVAFAVGIIIVFVKEGYIKSLGFGKEKIKTNLAISLAIIIIEFIIVLFISGLNFVDALKQMLYYLFFIAAIEEIVFRGIIQNYLFGFRINKWVLFTIGAVLFSLSHIPFQMYVHNEVSIYYFVSAIPNLIETFVFHFIFCYITYRRKDVTLSIEIHFAYNFLGIIF